GGACTEACDGTASLLSLRYEEQIATAPDGDRWEAMRTARVVTTWRLVDEAGTEIELLQDVGTLDRWLAHGPTEEAARAALPAAATAAHDLADSVGVAYGHRLTGGSWTYQRPYYSGGPLKLGAVALRAGDAEHALAQWNRVLQG